MFNKNLSTNNEQPMPNPLSSQTKTKSKSKLIIGLVVGVLALAGIGGAIWYFAGVPFVSDKYEVDLSDSFTGAHTNNDSTVVYKDATTEQTAEPAGVRLDTVKVVDLIDQHNLDKTNNLLPFGNNQEDLISPTLCAAIKQEMADFYISKTAPTNLAMVPEKLSTLTTNYSNLENNQVYVIIKVKDTKKATGWVYYPLKEYLTIKGFSAKDLMSVRWIYDPNYLLVSSEGDAGQSQITPLRPTLGKDGTVVTTKLKAKLCEGIETNEVLVTNPKDQFIEEDLLVNKKFGAYPANFLTGAAKSKPVLSNEITQILGEDKILTKATVNLTTVTPFTIGLTSDKQLGEGDGKLMFILSDGERWALPNEKEKVIKQEGGSDELDTTLTYNLSGFDAALLKGEGLRLVAVFQNITKTGVESKNNDFISYDNFYLFKKVNDKFVLTPTLYSVSGQKTNFVFDKQVNAVGLKYTSAMTMLFDVPSQTHYSNSLSPAYTQIDFMKLNDNELNEIIFGDNYNFYLAQKNSADFASLQAETAVVLPKSAPILTNASISFETQTKEQPVRPTPTPLPTETPIVSTVEGLGQECIPWHRGHTRVVLKCRFFTTDEAGKEKEKLNIDDPRKIAFKYGETPTTINLGANVYSDPNDAVYPYAIIVRGLKGGGKYDFTDEAAGWRNGRHKYFYQFDLSKVDAKFAGKLVGANFETLNRLQAIGYYYSLVLNRDYMKVSGAVDTWENPNNKFADKPLFDLENGGIKFWYDSNLTPTGIKFMLANDRKLKEYDTWLSAQLKDKGTLEAVKAMYPYHDRIYTNPKDEEYWTKLDVKPVVDFGRFYDDDGVIYWSAMTTDKPKSDSPKSIKNYYPKKGKKDVIDIFGVKFGIAVSEEAKGEMIGSLVGASANAQEQGAAQAEFAYQVVLKRGADEAGKAYAAKLKTYKKIAEYLADSKEYDSRIKDIEKDFGRNTAITEMYESIYGRPADVEGVGYWDNTKLALDILKQKFLTSEEFKAQ